MFMRKKGNVYFVNTVNTAYNKNNVLIYLTLPVDRSSPVESTPQTDFENTRDEDVDETSRKSYVDYSERIFTDLFYIPDYSNTDEDQRSSCSDNESDTGINESNVDEKRENNSRRSATKPNQN